MKLIKRLAHATYKIARRIVVAVVGATVIVIGLVMIVTPGPAFIVIPLGLAILGLEFAWAKHWLKNLKKTASSAFEAAKNAGKPKDS